MLREVKPPATPTSCQAGRGSGRSRTAEAGPQNDYKTAASPMALAVKKRGRSCVVAKLTYFDGSTEPILAVAWRRQKGTTDAISLPVAAIEFAKARGATRFYLRDDRRMAMWTCTLSIFDRGRLQPDGERYIPLAWLEPVAWRQWAYAEQIVTLDADLHEGEPQQLPLWGVRR